MKIFGIKLDKLIYKDFLKEISKLDKQNIIFTPNPEMLLSAKSDNKFKKTLEKSNFLIPDGIGLFIAFQILEQDNKLLRIVLLPYYFFNLFFKRNELYKKFGDKICGSDLTLDLVLFAEKKNIKITIIDLYSEKDDSKTQFQKTFKEKIKNKFPNLNFDYFIYNPAKKNEIIEQIKSSNSKILFSTLGMKRQEESIVEILGKCPNIKLGLGIGSSFDYFIGFQKRAPKIWRTIGLEWLYRLFTGPKKISRLKRLYNAIFIFIYKIIKSK